MSESQEYLDERGIDVKLLKTAFPGSFEEILDVVRLEDEYTYEACVNSPALGRDMSEELQSRIQSAKGPVVSEMIDDARINGLSGLKKKLRVGLGLGWPDEKDGEDVRVKPNSLELLVRSQLADSITLSLILTLRDDPEFSASIDGALKMYAGFVSDVNAMHGELSPELVHSSLYCARLLHNEFANLYEYLLFRTGSEGKLSICDLSLGDANQIRALANEVFSEITANRNYSLETVYNLDYELGKSKSPLTVLYQNSNFDNSVVFENMALVHLVGIQDLWDAFLAQEQDDLDVLLSGSSIRDALKGCLGESEIKESGLENLSVPSSVLGNMVLGVRWSDGELVVPNLHISFQEFLAENEKSWYEYLRLHVLLKLRSLLLEDYKDDEVLGIKRVLEGRKKHRKGRGKKPSFERIRIKVFPRTDKTSTSRAEGISPRDVRPHRVTGHKRRLPEGFYAAPEAVRNALANGVSLDFIEVDGVKRYVETFVRDYVKGDEDNTIVEAKFR